MLIGYDVGLALKIYVFSSVTFCDAFYEMVFYDDVRVFCHVPTETVPSCYNDSLCIEGDRERDI